LNIPDDYALWPLIEIYSVGPDGTCHCPQGANCKSPGKHPRGKDWQEGGQDPADFRRGANIGTLTGEPAGFWVLDIDQAGMAAMRELTDANGPLPRTRVHQTGGGTYHYFFKMPDFDVTNRRGSLPAGVDARGTGGQVVLPPSVSGKGEYRALHVNPIVDAPGWLLDKVRPPAAGFNEPTEKPSPEHHVAQGEDDGFFAAVEPQPEHLAKYERMVIDSEVARLLAMTRGATDDLSAYKGEPWDQSTYEVACTLMQLARSDWSTLTMDEAALLVRANAPRDPGFDDARVEEKIASAIRSTEGKTRSMPAPPSNTSWMDEIGDTAPAAPQAPQAPREPLHSLTDVGNARRLVDRRGGFIRWSLDAKEWVAFNGKMWSNTGSDVIVQNFCIETIEEARAQEAPLWSDVPTEFFANGQPKPSPREQFIAWTQKSLFEARLKAMASTARSDARVAASMGDFVAQPHLLNTQNCVVDLRDGSTHEHAPEWMMNAIAGTDFDPDAKAPMFEKFLERVQPDPVMRDYIQTVAGYSATGETREQAFFLHYGSGANGKSVFLEIIRRVLGSMGQKVARDTLYSKNGQTGQIPADIAAMMGARLLTASETAAGRKLDDERIKELVGGEAQRARNLFSGFFDFKPTGKIHLGTNHLPPMESGGHGMARRLRVIPWDVRIPEAERTDGLEDMIIEREAAGVLAWMVRGAQRWYAQGRLVTPQRVIDRTEVHIEDADPVWPFIRERIIAGDPEIQTEFKVLVAAYVSWCDMHNIRPMSGPALSAALSERLGEDCRFKHPRTRASMFRVRLNLEAVPSVAPTNWMEQLP
jgi:putative DNA primase/helicase